MSQKEWRFEMGLGRQPAPPLGRSKGRTGSGNSLSRDLFPAFAVAYHFGLVQSVDSSP